MMKTLLLRRLWVVFGEGGLARACGCYFLFFFKALSSREGSEILLKLTWTLNLRKCLRCQQTKPLIRWHEFQ
jgi:hypothetical protein